MKRKTSELPTRVWKYGIVTRPSGPDIGNREAVEDQLWRAHCYRNKRVEIEIDRRKRYTAAVEQFDEIAPLAAEIAALDAEVKAFRVELKAQRQKTRSRVKIKPEEREAIQEKKARIKLLRAEIKVAKQRRNTHPEIVEVNQWAHKEVTALRNADSTPFWGTYLRVDDSLKDVHKGAPPKYRGYDRTGSLAVQIQTSHDPKTGKARGWMTTETLLAGKDRRARLELIPEDVLIESRALILVRDQWHFATKARKPGDSTPNGIRCWSQQEALESGLGDQEALRSLLQHKSSTSQRAILHLRIGSDGIKPVWATFPMVLHRPLPAGASIKWIWVQRHRAAQKGSLGHPDDGLEWEACFAMESKFERPVRIDGDVAALNLGFRLLDNAGSLRLGFLVGTDGVAEELILPAYGPRPREGKRYLYQNGECRKTRPSVWTGISWASSKRGQRDKRFAPKKAEEGLGMRGRLVNWLKEHDIPEWLTKRTETLPRWRSCASLHKLIASWRQKRFDGDAEIYEELLNWARKDRHDMQHEAGLRSRAYRRRKHMYRQLARSYLKRYTTVFVPKMDLAKLKRKAKPEEGESELETVQREQMNTASLGELLDAFKLEAANLGSKIVVVEIPEGGITAAHYVCGKDSTTDRAGSIHLWCRHCQMEFDQDENAARNLLGFGLQPSPGLSESAG